MSIVLETGSVIGPASYAAGGFSLNTGLSTVNAFSLGITVAGSLMTSRVMITRNSPSAGHVTIQLMRRRYDKLSSVDAVTSLPSGITAPSSSGSNLDADAAHVHTDNHDHLTAATGTMTNADGGTMLDLTSPANLSEHTHNVNPDNFTGNTAAGSSHLHTWNNIYQHNHTVTQTETDLTLTEVANGTDLSGTTFKWEAYQ